MSDRDVKPDKPGSTFPVPTGAHDDDLMPHERQKLEVDGTRQVHLDLATNVATTGVVTLRTWECPTHKIVVFQGDPCPKCGKKLLLD